MDSNKQSLTILDYSLEVISLLGLVAILVLPIIFYSQLPETIPVHFNATGNPDSFGSKATLWILPALAAVIYVFITIGSRYPDKFNYPVALTPENTQRQYKNSILMLRFVKAIVTVLFFYVVVMSVLTGLNRATGIGIYFLPVFIVTLLGTIGFFLYRMFRLR
jgi:uncharacterized membrane protein